ncbi:MAG: transcriptional regulator [Planctomycetes bacterium]|nr:transcriptional regulator [Planctomycetota bacterium]
MRGGVRESDNSIVDLLRARESMTVSDLAGATEVTATAVRQRLNRLMARGDVERRAVKAGRGRPVHRYAITEQGRRRAGENLGDLAVALWKEVAAVADPGLRRGLMQRVSRRLADLYAAEMATFAVEDRWNQLASLFQKRQIPFEVRRDGERPVLTAWSCPYPGLADSDRSICAMERRMLSRLLGARLRLRSCRLDGDRGCSYEPAAAGNAGVFPGAES